MTVDGARFCRLRGSARGDWRLVGRQNWSKLGGVLGGWMEMMTMEFRLKKVALPGKSERGSRIAGWILG